MQLFIQELVILGYQEYGAPLPSRFTHAIHAPNVERHSPTIHERFRECSERAFKMTPSHAVFRQLFSELFSNHREHL